MLIALIAAFAQAATLIAEKWVLSKERVSRRDFLPLLFLLLFAFSGALSLGFGWVAPGYLSVRGLGLTALVIALATAWNTLYYRAIQSERASEVENVLILLPLAIILLDWALHPRLASVGVGAVIVAATAVLFWGFSPQGRLRLDRRLALLFVAVALMAGESVAIAILLQERLISPISLFAVRTGVMALILSLYFRPSLGRMGRRHVRATLIVALIGTGMMLARFFSFRDAGLVTSSVAFLLIPAFVYLGSAALLRERLRGRTVEAGLAMALLVVVGLTLV